MANCVCCESGDRVLLRCDAITDAGRGTPPGLGGGYVAMLAGLLRGRRPDLKPEIVTVGRR